MRSDNEHYPERRRHIRARWNGPAYAVTSDGRHHGPYAVESLSAGGALLVGKPTMSAHSQLTLLLELSPGKPVRVRAQVVRDAGTDAFAVVFLGLAASIEDRIQRLVLAKLKAKAPTRPTVLIVDDDDRVRRALEREILALGCRAVGAEVPADAARVLAHGAAPPRAAIVDMFLGKHDGLQLLRFVAVRYPQVRRVLISGAARTCQLELALQQGQAHAVLGKPWSTQELCDALG